MVSQIRDWTATPGIRISSPTVEAGPCALSPDSKCRHSELRSRSLRAAARCGEREEGDKDVPDARANAIQIASSRQRASLHPSRRIGLAGPPAPTRVGAAKYRGAAAVLRGRTQRRGPHHVP